MPEGAVGYPKWQGELSGGASWPVIVGHELRQAWNNQWVRGGIILTSVLAVLTLFQLNAAAGGADGSRFHTYDTFLAFIFRTSVFRALSMPYFAVLIAALTSASIIADSRRGALELYLSRAVTRFDYLLGKLLAVLGLTFLTIWLPILAYWGASYIIFEGRPDGWHWVPLQGLALAAIWAAVCAGLGLGLAAVGRSPRAGALILLGSFFALDYIVTGLLSAITQNDQLYVASPLVSLEQLAAWAFGTDAPYTWPAWWGALALGGYAVLGWFLFLWKHPRLRGVGA